jgi:hypothetical protein
MGRITVEFPLSACVTIASLLCSLVCIVFIVLDSGYVFCLEWGLLFCCRVFLCVPLPVSHTRHYRRWEVLIRQLQLTGPGFVPSFSVWSVGYT